MARKITRFAPPHPPEQSILPLVNATPDVARWLEHYWQKLQLPIDHAHRLAITDDRREYAAWTGRRLNSMALGCYCFLPLYEDDASRTEMAARSSNLTAPTLKTARIQPTLPGLVNDEGEYQTLDFAIRTAVLPLGSPDEERPQDFRHLIFVERDLLPDGIEVTVAHELIHLADRVSGRPRKHHCHGHDSISVDEAALTARDPEWLRELLAEETRRREAALRKVRPFKYVYVCPNCGKEYPRVKKYSRAVSCGHCDQRFNAAFLLQPRPFPNDADTDTDQTCAL